MDIIRNNKGGEKLCYGGYMYTRKAVTRERIRWICTRRVAYSCHGAISTDRGITILMNAKEHSHEADEAEVALAKLKHQRVIKNTYRTQKPTKTVPMREEVVLDTDDDVEEDVSGGGEQADDTIGGHTWRVGPDEKHPTSLGEIVVPDMTMISDSDQLPGQMVKSQHFTPEMTMISDSDQLPGQMVKSQHFTSEMTVISDSDQLSGQMVKSQRYTPEMTVISDSDQLPGQMVKTQCFSPEMPMISDSDQLPEQMVKTQHFAPELPVKCEPDQLEVQIVKTQHFTEAMEVQSAVAAATANIIPQSPIESYDPGPEQSLQNSKMRGCTDKDMALSFSASSRPVVVFKKTYVDPEHTDGMMKSLASLWRKRRLCDAKICSGDKNVTLHRLVLFAASPHLMEKNITDGADLEVNLPAGISEDGLKIFVSFLYDGVLNLNEHLYKDVERISNLLKVDKVQKHCREFSASLNEHRQMTSSPLMSIPRRRDNLPKSQKSSNRQTVVLTLSDDSNPAESSLGHPSTHQQPQEHTLTLSQSQYEDLQNNIDERIQALNEHHAFMTSHHDRYPPVTQNSGISLQTATNPTMASESGIKTEPIEILDDDITDYPPTTPPTQDNIKHSKRILNSSKSFASESPGSETMRRSSQNLPSSTVTRTYLPTSKCESGLDMNEMDGIATSGASSTTSPYPVSLVASSGETFPLYTLSSNQS